MFGHILNYILFKVVLENDEHDHNHCVLFFKILSLSALFFFPLSSYFRPLYACESVNALIIA